MASAADIITYAGIPLAVLGVLPTLFIFLRSLITLRDVRRSLSKNNVTALTRPSMLTGIIELEIPRKSISPLNRFDPRYFEVNESASDLKGGSWTSLNWRELATGTKCYRLQYHDELEQPAAEVEFEELVAFLLDRGAVPNSGGFADLRAAGLWTPAGTVLLKSPKTADAVLRTATSEDSDGKLSLIMEWRSEWDMRSVTDLPPYWMRLHAPEDGKQLVFTKVEAESTGEKNPEPENLLEAQEKSQKHSAHLSVSSINHLTHLHTHRRISVSSAHSRLSHISRFSHMSALSQLPDYTPSLRLQLSNSGATTILTEPSQYPFKTAHINPPHPISFFFSSIATALGAPRGGLWSFTPPSDLITLSLTPSIPCGVLVLLSLLDESNAPTWRTSSAIDHELQAMEQRKKQDQRMRTMMEENRLPPAEAQKARLKRMQDEAVEWQYETRRKVVEAQKRADAELVEGLASQRMGMPAVATACRAWLVKEGHIEEKEETEYIIERLLWEIVTRKDIAEIMGRIFVEWKVWAESGGMTKTQYELIGHYKLEFCYAAIAMAFMGEHLPGDGGNVATDMQDCLRLWKKVRLG